MKISPLLKIFMSSALALFSSNQLLKANELSLGKTAKSKAPVVIPATGLAKFNGITQEQLYKLRSDAVLKHKELLADTYEPSDAIFGMCESKKPWWGVYGMNLYRQGERAIEGPSKESSFILNPFRLISAEANNIGLWNAKAVSPEDMKSPDFPFQWEAGPVVFDAQRNSATVLYNITKYNANLEKYKSRTRVPISFINSFSLISYNARDFGLHYMYLDPQKSVGLARWPAHAVQITQFLHCGGSCGYPGGCNNMSPHIPELDGNKLLQLPARAYIKLWNSEPESVGNPADFTYIIDFK